MKIVIDVQTLFTEEKDRGIGRYTFQLINSILKIDNKNEYVLCALSEPNDLCKSLLKFPNVKYQRYELNPSAEYYKQVSPYAPLFQSTNFADVDIIHITSLLMHNILIPVFYPVQTIFTIYDLIPLVFKDKGENALPEHLREDYELRLKEVKRATKIAAISDCTKNDLVKYLNVPEDMIINISGGIDSVFKKIDDVLKISSIKQKYGIETDYILTLSGFNPRKNMEGTLRAYSKLARGIRDKYKLVVVCGLNDEERRILRDMTDELGITDDVIFTGFVPDEELVYLLNGATLFLFLSLYEGFGLPVAEAMACGLPVVASDVSSIPEVCSGAGLLVNPNDTKQVANLINSLLRHPGKLQELREKSLEKSRQFTFEEVARKCIGIYESIYKETMDIYHIQDEKRKKVVGNAYMHSSQIGIHTPNPSQEGNSCKEQSRLFPTNNLAPHQFNEEKIKVAYFSPFNPQKTGISDYSEELLLYLKSYLDIDIYTDFISLTNEEIENLFPLYNYRLFNSINKEKQYDAIIYHLGNNDVHKYIYRMMQIHPSITVMHDLNIVGFLSSFTIFDNNPIELAKEFIGIYGDDVVALGKALQNGNMHIDFKKYFLSQKAIEYSKAILVHNRYCQQELEKSNCGKILVQIIRSGIRLPENVPGDTDKKKAKRELGIDENIFMISSFGFVNPFKRISRFLMALYRILMHHPNVRFYCVGEILGHKKPYLDMIIKRYMLKDNVFFTGHIDMETFHKYIIATDLCINLRYPSFGETSATLLRVLSYGVPSLVSNINQYKEIPDDCCWKVDVDENEIEELVQFVDVLIRSDALRKKMSENAIKFIRNGFDWEDVSREYYRFVKSFIKKNAEGE